MVTLTQQPRKPLLGAPRLGDGEGGGMSFPVVVGLAGLGSIYAAKSFDGAGEENTKMLMKVAGFGAVGFALYSLVSSFGSEASAKTATDEKTALPGEVEFAKVTGTFLAPVQGAVISRALFGKGYNVKVLLTNPSAKPLDVIYQILATERPTYLFGADAGWWTPLSGQVAQSFETVPAKGSIPVNVSVVPLSSASAWANIGISLTLQAKRAAGDAWKTLASVGFDFMGK